MSDELVHRDDKDGIATVTFDSPDNRNALSEQLVRELGDHLTESVADSAVRAIRLTHTGTVFCAGADLKGSSAAAVVEYPRILAAIMRSPKPVIAELHGPARAGGIGMVAAADIAVAPVEATFAFTEVRIGVVPAIITVPLIRRVGIRQLERWYLTGERFGAADAAAAGLLTAAVPAPEVGAWTEGVLADLRLASPNALAGIKPLLAGVRQLGIDEALAWTAEVSAGYFGSDDAAEGMAAFIEKRPPSWASGH